MTTPHQPRNRARTQQRFGHVTGHSPNSGEAGSRLGGYLICDDETGTTYTFDDADIVTEGIRAVRTGERARFLIDHERPGRASYIIRLDELDTVEYYQ